MKTYAQSLLPLAVLLNTAFAAPASSNEFSSFPVTDVLGTGLTIDEYAQQLASGHATGSGLSKRQYSSDTYNQLTDGTPCRDIELIYARGTTQAGNVGAADKEGPAMFDALATQLGGTSRLAIQGVDYPATIGGFLEGGDPGGAVTTYNLINQAVTQCPQSKIVVSGYSQGAQLVHIATQNLTASVASQISAVLCFGDPDSDQGFGFIDANKTEIFCHSGDEICKGTIIVTPDHTDYEKDASTLAAFIVSKVGP